MKISLITVTLNAEEFIEDCIQSVLNQTHKNIEYIVIDGGSTDSTLSIVQKFDSFVSIVVSEGDLGIYDAMNKGIAMATGEVIGTLNSDDFFADETILEDIAKEFKNSSTDIVYGDLCYINRGYSQQILRNWKSKPYIKNLFQWGWMPAHPTFYARRELFKKYGNYNLNYRTAADYELMLRFMHKHQVSSKYLPKVFVKMRVGGVSNITLKNRLNASRYDFKAMIANGIKVPWIAILLKPLRKLVQFI